VTSLIKVTYRQPCKLIVWNLAMGQIRGNTRKGLSGSDEDIGRMGRGGKTPIRITRMKGCERKEEKRTECEEKHDMMVDRMYIQIRAKSEHAAGRTPILA
jgi:hypothetical protein